MMKKLLNLVSLIPAVMSALSLQLQAQQTTPTASKPSTPAARRSSSTPGAGKASTPAVPKLEMPVESKATPASSRSSSASSEATSKPRVSNWEVYPADQMPKGKSLTEEEAVKLESGDYSEKVLYLVGTYYVAVAQKDRAILWPNETLGPVHVVVAYPLSIPIPREGAKIVREAPRGYRITRVKHPEKGETTIYVRDMTVP